MDIAGSGERARRLLLVAAVAVAGSARADLFSPGDLIKPHQHLEGLSNCSACHLEGEALSPKLCLDCHTELATLVKQSRGFHGRMTKGQLDACEKCHPDHQGRDAAPTLWGPGGVKGFDHALTGWPLKDKHAKAACNDCHAPRFIVRPEVLAWTAKNPRCKTYLGATDQCAGCHFDEHRGDVKGACDKCHDAKAWDPAPLFKHAKTKYPLRGLHAKVKCAACHPKATDVETPADAVPAPKSATYLKMAPVPHATCVTCHEDDDTHKNKYGQRCESCHGEDGWRVIKADGFDRRLHDKHDFKLEGAHGDVECAACHGPFGRTKAKFKDLAFERCSDCHVDAHAQQFEKGRDCADCHTPAGWAPSKYGEREHAKSDYPLEGAHRAAPCSSCHAPEPSLASRVPASARRFLQERNRPATFSDARFDFPKQLERCEACHADVHAKQFENTACSKCHAVEGWKKLTFDHDRDSDFKLEGAHEKASCRGCHPERELRGTVALRFKRVEKKCAGCHADVHVGQFGAAPDCAKCHGNDDFEKSTFTHAPPATGFKLEGAHAGVKCGKCHPKVKVAAGVEAVRYRPLPTTCAGCHEDHHKGDFGGFGP